MTPAVTGGLVGLLGAAGLWLTATGTPFMRRRSLADRMAPYLRDTPRASRLLTEPPSSTTLAPVQRLLGPLLADLATRIDRTLGGSASVRRRLAQSGSSMTVEQFRIEQVVWAAGGLLVGLLLAVMTALRGRSASPVAFLILSVVLAMVGVFARDRVLSAAVARREARMLAELPTVAELLALTVAAGEGPVGALERVARLSTGELSTELSRALADARAGAPLVGALEAMAARTGLPALARFVDGMAIAVERGTPLADVLRAQAVDVREQGRRALLEAAGRKEIAMLVPVVFLVLPVTVVFALFPGFYNLSLSVS